MGKKANPAIIGAFVVAAIALLVGGILVFGSGRMFKRSHPFVLYFGGNINGLRIGAPVKFKGVEIGSVSQILLRLDQSERDTHIPVLIEIDEEKLRSAGVTGQFGDPRVISKAIELGLRGRLETESFVTGVLYVNLEYFPDTQSTFIATSGKYQEIPTLPSQLEEAKTAMRDVLKRLDEINFKGLIEEFTKTAGAITGLAGSPELRAALASFDQTMKSASELANTMNGNLGPMADGVKQAAISFKTAADRMVIVEDELRDMLRNANNLVDPASPLAYQLKEALASLGQASQSIRVLAEYLQRNPNSLVVGRPPERSAP